MREGREVFEKGATVASEKEPLHVRVATQLKSRIEAAGGDHLPTFAELSREFGVSLKTVSMAVHLLRDEGIVDITQGAAVVIRGRVEAGTGANEKPWGWESTAGRLYRKLAQAIESGTYRSGENLPKVKYFTVSEKATERTVCAAFAMLRRDNLVHRRGKHWVVGPSAEVFRGAPALRASGSSSPVILIVTPEYSYWREFFREHLRVFVAEFLACLRHHDVEFMVVQTDEPGSSLARYHPTGEKQIADTVAGLGSRYQGVYVHSTLAWLPEIEHWIRWLLQFGKPVVWFDYDDSAPSLDKRALDSERYFRLYGNIASAVDLAIRSLCVQGHRRIGIAQHGPYSDHEWSVRRVGLLRSAGQKREPPVSVEVQQAREEFWSGYEDLVKEVIFDDIVFRYADTIDAGLKRASPSMSANARRRAVRSALLDASPCLANLVSHGCTAIVALNQFMAVNTLYWLRLVGLDVPADISLVSFDNVGPLVNHPISTVDFGFANLGYQAAHIFIGDIPMRTDKWGNIASRPQLINRGSLGAPRKRPLRFVR